MYAKNKQIPIKRTPQDAKSQQSQSLKDATTTTDTAAKTNVENDNDTPTSNFGKIRQMMKKASFTHVWNTYGWPGMLGASVAYVGTIGLSYVWVSNGGGGGGANVLAWILDGGILDVLPFLKSTTDWILSLPPAQLDFGVALIMSEFLYVVWLPPLFYYLHVRAQAKK